MPVVIAPNAEPIPGYRLLDKLGGGGFGEVWRAEAPGGLLKAIKVIHGDLSDVDPDGSRHATQELRALKRVQTVRHPYLLSLERYDIVEGRLLIVMELADCNLWDRFRQYRGQGQVGIPREELLRYMEESAEVLDMMNAQHQLQHLDIKPQNLFLIYNHVKVADFGLVKDLEGMRAQVTGGVTPVYAAPETFDGVVTRFCDQYSLAIVYQELLTGQRPFNGASMQQLLMQHLQSPPNLAPAPPADRPALARALAKKPEDRFPTCMDLVRALQTGGTAAPGARAASMAEFSLGSPPPSMAGPAAQAPRNVRLPVPQPQMDTPVTVMPPRREEFVEQSQFISSPARIAPPEVTGDGALRPALVIGIGQCGLEVVSRFRRAVAERFGAFEKAEQLRVLYLDTDPEALQAATQASQAAKLAPEEVVPLRLDRAGHYLKPRRNGRSLIEGWFDQALLYRIPRIPATTGVRALGRLAYCDHYRAAANRIQQQLESATHPDTVNRSNKYLQLGLRTNRPRVYIVAGLGGGTGGGMFLDAAYTVRHKLRFLGYADPEVMGVFFLPPLDAAPQRQLAMANAYAALCELNHFADPETTYAGSFDDRDGQIDDPSPPVREAQFFLLPPPGPQSAGPAALLFGQVADHLCRDLTTPFGRSLEETRARVQGADAATMPVRVFGCAAFSWPRRQLVSQASTALCGRFLAQWTSDDNPAVAHAVGSWVQELWAGADYRPEAVISRLQQVAERALGAPPDAWFASLSEPLAPKGFFSREPEPQKLWEALSRSQQVVGMPDEVGLQRHVGQFEPLLAEAAEYLIREYQEQVGQIALTLIDQPDYRLAGGEQAIAALTNLMQHAVGQYEPLIQELSRKAREAFFAVNEAVVGGSGRRRLPPAELVEQLKQFPRWRYQSLVLRQVCRIYLSLRAVLSDQLREVHFSRKRLEELAETFAKQRGSLRGRREADVALLPPGVATLEEAVDRLIGSLRPEDYSALDRQMQAQIETQFVNLSQLCLTSRNLGGDLQAMLLDQARSFLNGRLGDADVVEMFLTRYPDQASVTAALRQAFEAANPPLGAGRRGGQLCVLGLPEGPLSERVRMLSHHAFPQVPLEWADARSEVLLYREVPRLGLIDLPHLGPVGHDAYRAAAATANYTPHARTDITRWVDVESG